MITKKVIRTTAVMLSEESVSNRLDKARGFSSINQLQNLIMVSKSALNFNLHERLHTEGSTNRGNVIGPLDMDPLDDHTTTWRMKVADKFTLLGRHGPKIPVGGPGEPEPDDMQDVKEKHKPRDKKSEEPFLFHSMPTKLFQELIHATDAVAIIALAADGKAAMATLEERIPFAGLAFTPDHAKLLSKRLERQVFQKYQDPSSKLYQSGLSQILGGAQAPQTTSKSTHSTKKTTPPKAGVGEAKAEQAKAGQAKKAGQSKAASATGDGTDLLSKVKALAAAAAAPPSPGDGVAPEVDTGE